LTEIILTGNQYVDNGVATIAALGNCKGIEDLTLRKMKNVDDHGMKLARNNDRPKSTRLTFQINSILTNLKFNNNKNRLKNYAKITTAILNNIGHEQNE